MDGDAGVTKVRENLATSLWAASCSGMRGLSGRTQAGEVVGGAWAKGGEPGEVVHALADGEFDVSDLFSRHRQVRAWRLAYFDGDAGGRLGLAGPEWTVEGCVSLARCGPTGEADGTERCSLQLDLWGGAFQRGRDTLLRGTVTPFGSRRWTTAFGSAAAIQTTGSSRKSDRNREERTGSG